MRLQCLHDGYDYSSASTFAIQNKSEILGAILFATDRGDTHISLDRLKNATIKAKDLRLRLLFEGNLTDLKLPDNVQLNQSIKIPCGSVNCVFQIAHAVFDDYPINIQTGRNDNSAWLDIILYEGEQKDINFAEISQAVVIFALSLNAQSENTLPLESQRSIRALIINPSAPGLVSATWNQMFLTIPFKPMKTSEQKAATAARKIGKDPWKSPAFINP
jgi:hypothetical protein